MRSYLKRYGFYALTLTIFVVGFVFWQSDLTSDPPMYYSGLGQSLSTDPAQYIFHARNKVLFGQFDPYDYPRWTVYQHSLTSLVGYLWFSTAGVSLQQANMVGVILSFGGLIFLVLGIARHHRPWVTTSLVLCFIINATVLTYGRLPYLEHGLIFIASLVFFVYSWWGYRIWGAALAGGLVALAMLIGKLFGVLLLPALILAVFFSRHTHKWRLVSASVISFFLVSIATILLSYGRDFQAALGYVGEQAYGLRGFPQGLTSPWSFFEHLISYGFANHLFYLDVDLLLFLLAAVVLFVLYLAGGGKIKDLSPTTIFAMFWLPVAIVGLAPLSYSPIRYALLVIPPIILFCFSMIDSCFTVKKNRSTVRGKVQLTLLFFVLWFVLFHAVANIFFFDTYPRPIRALTWATLPGGVGLVFLVRFLVARGNLQLSKRKLVIVVIGLLGFSVLFNGYQINRKHRWERNFNIVEANRDLEAILLPGAVVSGPFGPTLTIDSHLKSFIHLFGVATVDPTLFDRYPVTHLAVDISNWAKAVKNYPALERLKPITSYWIRDTDVCLFNISDVYDNPQARMYQKSPFENAVAYYADQRYDSALNVIETFYRSHPESKSAGLLLAQLLLSAKRYQDVFNLFTTLANRFLTDFNIQLQCGRFIQILAHTSKDPNLSTLAQRYYEKAVRVNPYKGDYARNLWLETTAQLTGTPSPTGP